VIVRRAVRWLDERLGAAHFARTALNKVFPDHWSFMFGEIALYAFVILVATGIYLTMFFRPDSSNLIYHGAYAPLRGVKVSAAYKSVMDLSFEVRSGLVFRQMHHWAALVFVGAIVLHLCRIFFTGAFRRPRELNWIIGITLLLLAIFNGFTGYSLPDDLLSGTGLRIANAIMLSIPFVGVWMAQLVFGGEFPSADLIRRLYAFHILIVPALLAALLAAHLAILWRQKHTQFPGPHRTDHNVVGSRLWPTYAVKSLGLLFGLWAIMGALAGLAQINPVWLWGPHNPAAELAPAQPDWYLGWLEGALRIFPAWEIRTSGHMIPNPFYPAVLLPGITFMALYLWPFIEARFTRDRMEHQLLNRPRDVPLRTAIGAGAITFYFLLFLAGSNDVLAKVLAAPVSRVTWGFRIAVVTVPFLVGWLVHRVCLRLRSTGHDADRRLPREPLAHPVGETR
jgi:quinol---cytochrome-c reductase cytochrome b subunit